MAERTEAFARLKVLYMHIYKIILMQLFIKLF